MKKDKYETYIQLRRHFKTMAELGDVINKTGRTVFTKMKETGFTDREQFLILQYLGVEDTEENRKFIFSRR